MDVKDIKSPNIIKKMNTKQLDALAHDIRSFLVSSVSKTGGHLSSNLGIVELTIALHYVFDSPYDKIFFDVGHQSYVHKILTGRAKEFSTLRQFNGLSGFQKRKESIHDVWEAGHSSTSLSAALGFAIARDLNHESYGVIPVIGDGAMASGMSFEALNQIGFEKRSIIIIFNDNEMSISENVGAFSHACTQLRASKGYVTFKKDLSSRLSSFKIGDKLLNAMKGVKDSIKHTVVDASFFSEMGLDYIGPVDGHDINDLIKVLQTVRNHEGPIVVHVITKKGKGYQYAENDNDGRWHGVSKFNIENGQPISSLPINHLDWSSILSASLIRLAEENTDIVALTPAMKKGSKLDTFAEVYPNRFFDCGIAEEHALTLAASLALNHKRPFINVYSSFIQRAYDQINHDVARMKLPVVIGVDRCGLVGEDGETHHGVFDISAFYSIPNLIISQPKDAAEAQDLMYSAFQQKENPYIIRIARGSVPYQEKPFSLIETGSWTAFTTGTNPKAIVIAYGMDVDHIIQKAKVNAFSITVINARFLKPLDEAILFKVLHSALPIIVYENDVLHGGLSSAILAFKNDHQINRFIKRIGIGDHFVPHGSLPQLRKSENIDFESLFAQIERYCK